MKKSKTDRKHTKESVGQIVKNYTHMEDLIREQAGCYQHCLKNKKTDLLKGLKYKLERSNGRIKN
jgi:hypothetical protein